MILRQLFDQATSTYTYLVADGGEAVLIDPVAEQVDRDLQLLRELGLRLAWALDTHVHADHITGAGMLRERTGCATGLSRRAGVECATHGLAEGDEIPVGRHRLQVLETPGHTDTCLSYVLRDPEGRPHAVFTGDALLIRGCGRVDFQSGDAARLYDSITGKLFALPDETLVYPGHDYRGLTVSTIGEERRHNPRLALGREGFIRYMESLELPLPARIQEALPANRACGQGTA